MESNIKDFRGARIASAILFIYFALDGVDCITDVFRNQMEVTLFYLVAVFVTIVANILIAISIFKKNFNLLKVGFLILMIAEAYIALDDIAIAGLRIGFGIRDILIVVAALMSFLMVKQLSVNEEGKPKGTLQTLWFVPAICAGLAFLISAITSAVVGLEFTGYLFTLMVGVAKYLLLGMYLGFPDGFEKKVYNPIDVEDENIASTTFVPAEPAGYYSMAKHIILLIFTFGIWWLIWIYRATEFLNCVKGEKQRGAVAQLLLCMFVPFYIIYWTYESAKRIDKLAKTKDVESDITTMCILFAIFIGILAPIFMQDKINAIVMAKNKTTSSMEEPVVEEKNIVQVVETVTPIEKNIPKAKNVAEDLKTYKDLLDGGIITQEEFDAKKKELLGL